MVKDFPLVEQVIKQERFKIATELERVHIQLTIVLLHVLSDTSYLLLLN